MQQVVEILSQLLGRPLPVETDPAKVRPVERPHLQADVTRLRERLGWVPHADLRRGLAELLAAELPS
jgi:UDP-glucose 4-epimerase